MKKHIIKISLFLGISFLFMQCLKKDEIHLSAEEISIVKIKEAKEFFEIQFQPDINSTKADLNTSEGKSKRHTLKKNLDWEKAYTKLMQNGELGVYVPVLYDEDTYFIKGKWAWHSLSGLSYVLIYEKEKGKKSLEVVTTFPDADYLLADEKPEVFSGVVYVEDWNGKFIKSIRHFDGKMYLLENLNNSKSSLYTLCSTVIDWYTCSYYGCNYNYSEIVYYVCDDSSGGLPVVTPDYSPSGGGTTTPTDTTEECNCDICPVCGGCIETSYKYVPADDDTVDPTENVPDCPTCTCPVSQPEVIIDPSFEDTKAECVYSKLHASSNGFKTAIQKFDGEFPVAHLELKIDITMTSNTRKAYTTPPSNYIISVVLNGNPTSDASYQQRPNLLVAKTIIHEVIHAEMFRKLLSIANNGGDLGGLTSQGLTNMLSNGDYPGIFDYYTRFGVNGFQHVQMAAHYRDVIADALQEFDNSAHSRQFYEDMSWEGLIYSNDPTWSELSLTEKSRILNVLNAYLNLKKNEICQ